MFHVIDRPANLSKLVFKKKIEKIVLFFLKLNIFIIYNFLDQFRIHHWRGHILNFQNIFLSIFSVANSISYTASKTGVSFMPFWPLKGEHDIISVVYFYDFEWTVEITFGLIFPWFSEIQD